VAFTDWTGGPRRDFEDPRTRSWNFDEGITGAARRAADRYPQAYDPARLLDPDGGFQRLADEVQHAVDRATHMRPDPPHDHLTDAGNPYWMPDWDHDGHYGDTGDFDADTDARLDTGWFLYPCPALDGRVLYETTDGRCLPPWEPVTYKQGLAREIKVVNSRGLVLDATLWLPHTALDGRTTGFSGVVFANGIASRQDLYYWFAMRAARAGYIVVTYDPAGQGESEGTTGDLFVPGVAGCTFGGACRDLKDMVRWFVGDPVVALTSGTLPRVAPRHDPRYAPAGANLPNPAAGLLDRSRIAIAGNSMGALSVLNYLLHLHNGAGADGRPLPRVRAAVALSGAADTAVDVPLQFQTSDYDGSPTLVGPGVGGLSLGSGDQGIGYAPIKRRYDELRAARSGRAAMELLVLAGGTHTDHVNAVDVPRTLWSVALAGEYAVEWMDCHARDDPGACVRATSPRPHLSRAFASEHDPDGPAGAAPSWCITVPDAASLNQSPQALAAALAGSPPHDCKRPA
jgi:dienelactone hydrolase